MNNILIKNLNKKFKDRIILEKVNLQFEEGKIYAICGKSGCGKTTLLNIISGFDFDYDGSVFINGIDLKEIKDIDLKSYHQNFVSYIHQSSTCFEKLTILDNVKLPYLSSNYPEVSISNFNLNYDVNKKVSKLSKGEQKRINIIQNFYKNSKILLLDEPTASLDDSNAELIMNNIKSISKNKIVIFVTHNKTIAKKYGDEIIEINNGKIIKNYKNKSKSDDLKINQSKNINLINTIKSSNKFVKSEKNNNNLLTSSCIIVLLCLGLIMSLLIGCKEYFVNQIENSNKETTLSFTTNNSIINIDNDDIDSFISLYPNDEFNIVYKSSDNLNCTIDNIELTLPSYLIDEPSKYCEGLEEDQIILTVPRDFLDQLEEIYDCDDIEDYMLFNNMEFSIYINNNIFTYNIKEFFVSENNKFELNYTNTDLYKIFHNDDEEKYLTINSLNMSEDFIEFANTTKEYYFYKEEDLISIYKFKNTILDYENFINKYTNSLPIYEDDNCFWINYFEEILYFKDIKIQYGTNSVNETIFYSPFAGTIKKGRNIENDNEIVISDKLFKTLNISSLQQNVSLTFNNKSKDYKLVGVSDDDDSLYIYQSLSWARNEFVQNFLTDIYTYKPYNFLLTTLPNQSEELSNTLKDEYPLYTTKSYVGEAINELESILNNIWKISLIVLIALSFFSIFSIVILCILEKIEYKKQINIMHEFGYDSKELNHIYIFIFIKRAIKTFIFSSIYICILIKLINNLMLKEDIFDNKLLSNSIIIYVCLFILSIVIYLLSYIFVKFNKRKALTN